MVRFCAFAVIGVATLGGPVRVNAEGTPNARAYHLDEYTAAAIQHYPSLKAAKADIELAHARLNEAKLSPFFQFHGRAAFFVRPKASGTPVFSPDSQIQFNNPWGPGVELAVEGGIPIYTFGKYRAGKTAARAGIKTAEQDQLKTLNQVVFDVRRAYFGTQLSLDLQSRSQTARGSSPTLSRSSRRVSMPTTHGSSKPTIGACSRRCPRSSRGSPRRCGSRRRRALHSKSCPESSQLSFPNVRSNR